MLRFKRRRGFTLVELLIVIIIIGILAGSMMLTMGKARAKARATRIVNDMIAIKRAAQFYFADNLTWFEIDNGDKGYGFYSASILDGYLDQKIIDKASIDNQDDYGDAQKNRYFIYANKPEGSYKALNGRYNIFVIANVMDVYADYATRLALERMAPSIGLFKGSYTDHLDKDPEDYYFIAKENPTKIVNEGNGGIVMRIN